MPLIDLDTFSGPENFAYFISTPTDASAERIVQGLPTILLIHPGYVSSAIFHPIFSDPRLRRFNLVAMDIRGHGWTSAKVENRFNRELAATDILKLMEALDISVCHFMGVSMGASIAAQVSVLAPEKVLSMFLLSPLPLVEPPESVEGRQEIYECWKEAFRNDDGIDHTAVGDALHGGLQLAYNNMETPLIKAMTSVAVEAALRNWSGDKVEAMHTVTVKFVLARAQHPPSALARVRCPVLLVHCSEDIVYPPSHAEELLKHLRSVKINARLCTLEGAPHFGNATHPNETNTLLYDFVIANCVEADLPPAPAGVQSPFLAELAASGLLEDDSDYED
ncbi:AB hydrolase-1 domain-containing protein [Mycena venus]|uniref:AB hydrolase-1 domain-containing protein n=1 Tax=Mycena venus TaxID=2733690 RepID=A0A8H7D9C9_9AGAR|nr:AB hydrolase-1 domain-containing protein [Mycena venus]